MTLSKTSYSRGNSREPSLSLQEIMLLARQIREAHASGKITAEEAAVMLDAIKHNGNTEELQMLAG